MELLAARTGAWNPAIPCCNGAAAGGRRAWRRICVVIGAGAAAPALGYQKCLHQRERHDIRSFRLDAASPIIKLTGRQAIEFRAGALPEEAAGDRVVIEIDEEMNTEPEESVQEEDPTTKAKVTFTLQKEIHFGQMFNVAGSTAELGKWDLAAAVPMVWSEDHVWNAEVVLPVGQTVQYKFFLTGRLGELEWQPGENQSIEINDANDAVASGVWDAPESSTQASDEIAAVEESVQNGVVPGSDIAESIAVAIDEAAALANETADDVLSEVMGVSNNDHDGTPDEEEDSPELPVLGVALATAVVAEVLDDSGASQSGSSSPKSVVLNDLKWTVNAISSLFQKKRKSGSKEE